MPAASRKFAVCETITAFVPAGGDVASVLRSDSASSLVFAASVLIAKYRSLLTMNRPNASFPVSLQRQKGLVMTVLTLIPSVRNA